MNQEYLLPLRQYLNKKHVKKILPTITFEKEIGNHWKLFWKIIKAIEQVMDHILEMRDALVLREKSEI